LKFEHNGVETSAVFIRGVPRSQDDADLAGQYVVKSMRGAVFPYWSQANKAALGFAAHVNIVGKAVSKRDEMGLIVPLKQKYQGWANELVKLTCSVADKWNFIQEKLYCDEDATGGLVQWVLKKSNEWHKTQASNPIMVPTTQVNANEIVSRINNLRELRDTRGDARFTGKLHHRWANGYANSVYEAHDIAMQYMLLKKYAGSRILVDASSSDKWTSLELPSNVHLLHQGDKPVEEDDIYVIERNTVGQMSMSALIARVEAVAPGTKRITFALSWNPMDEADLIKSTATQRELFKNLKFLNYIKSGGFHTPHAWYVFGWEERPVEENALKHYNEVRDGTPAEFMVAVSFYVAVALAFSRVFNSAVAACAVDRPLKHPTVLFKGKALTLKELRLAWHAQMPESSTHHLRLKGEFVRIVDPQAKDVPAEEEEFINDGVDHPSDPDLTAHEDSDIEESEADDEEEGDDLSEDDEDEVL